MYNQRSKRFKFKKEKALEVLLYVLNEGVQNLYHIVKCIYFADRIHLEKYGRFVSTDSYAAMNSGPVPSNIYDMIKMVRGDGNTINFQDWNLAEHFKVDGHSITPLRKANLDYSSISDIKCLNNSIKEFGEADTKELYYKSHDSAYHSVDRNEIIPVENIASVLKDGEKIVEFLNTQY